MTEEICRGCPDPGSCLNGGCMRDGRTVKSTTPKVVRYFHLDWAPWREPTICDRVWWDGKTGKIVLRYDLADPANRDPNYGATPDRYVLADKGHDVNERIDEAEMVLTPDAARKRMEEW